jgi:hypothetical protein
MTFNEPTESGAFVGDLFYGDPDDTTKATAIWLGDRWWPYTGAPEPILQFFSYSHLPQHLQGCSKMFSELAMIIVTAAPRNPERTVALRKLLEAKDAAVRSLIYKEV